MNKYKPNPRRIDRLCADPCPTIDQILHVVSVNFGVSQRAIISPLKTQGIACARHVACYLARTMTEHSFSEIAEALGRTDHTTARNSVLRVQGWMDERPAFAAKIKGIVSHLETTATARSEIERLAWA